MSFVKRGVQVDSDLPGKQLLHESLLVRELVKVRSGRARRLRIADTEELAWQQPHSPPFW